MKKRQWIISLVVGLIVLVIGAILFRSFSGKKESTINNSPKKADPRTVRIDNFPPQKVNAQIEIDGRVQAFEKINLSAEVQGRLLPTGKTIKEGVSFSEGELLFMIENRDDIFNVKAQRAQLFASITQIMPDLKFDYPDAFIKWKTYLDQFDVDKSIQPLPTSSSNKEKYFIGGKTIMNQYYMIKSQEEKLKNYAIYAPFNGVFLSVNNFPGSLVSPGVALAQIMNTYQYEMVSPIAPQDLAYVTVGQTVTLESEQTGKQFKGRVSRTSRQIDQSTQSIPLYISVSGNGLRDGMYLKGTLQGDASDGISTIPKDIIVNQSQVYVYADSTLIIKEVDVQYIKEDKAYVKGLSESDQVVVSSLNNLYSGQKVKL